MSLAAGPLVLSQGPSYQQQTPEYEDVWVTVYGFSQQDVPLILREFGQCGDILQWGTFGVAQANFLHIQVRNPCVLMMCVVSGHHRKLLKMLYCTFMAEIEVPNPGSWLRLFGRTKICTWFALYGHADAHVFSFAAIAHMLGVSSCLANARFVCVQYQNKYAAQRALNMNGSQLTPSLIIGVKLLDHRHRAAIQEYNAGGQGQMQKLQVSLLWTLQALLFLDNHKTPPAHLSAHLKLRA